MIPTLLLAWACATGTVATLDTPEAFATVSLPANPTAQEEVDGKLHLTYAGERDAVVATITKLMEAEGWKLNLTQPMGPMVILGFMRSGKSARMLVATTGDKVDVLVDLG